MPFVIVHMWEGRTVDEKRALTQAITQAMVDHAHTSPDALHVVIQEYAKDNWARAGVLGIDRHQGADDSEPAATAFPAPEEK